MSGKAPGDTAFFGHPRGLATLLPTILTIIILVWIGNFLYYYISAPIHSGWIGRL